MSESPWVQPNVLRDFVINLFTTVGTPRRIAKIVSGILVNADLAGHTSHGVLRIPGYLHQIEHKSLIPDAEPTVVKETPSAALVDGRQGWGHYVAQWSMTLAMKKARETGVAAVSISRANHIGRLGEYAEQAAAQGFISIVTTGGGGRGGGATAPFGGAEKALGTNPIAIGVPTGDEAPFVSDFATTMVANGKVEVAQLRGTSLAPGCLLDRDGQPSVNPSDYFNGGRLLLFAGHKAYALSLVTCLLGGLTGGYDVARGRMGGTFLMALDVRAFQSLDEYQGAVRGFLDAFLAIPPAPGYSEVLVPGEPERRAREVRMRKGVELPEALWRRLNECGERHGLTLGSSLDETREAT